MLGATGQVLMNNKGVHVPSYVTYMTKNGTMHTVVELNASLVKSEKCDNPDEFCSEHVKFLF